MPGLPGDEGTEGSAPATAGDTGKKAEKQTEIGFVLYQYNWNWTVLCFGSFKSNEKCYYQ